MIRITLLALAMADAAVALAQGPQASPGASAPGFQRETPVQRMDHLAILLDLTDEQKSQVQAILQEEHAKAKAAHERPRGPGGPPPQSTPPSS